MNAYASSTPASGVNHAVHTSGGISSLMMWDDGDPHPYGRSQTGVRLSPSGITSYGEQEVQGGGTLHQHIAVVLSSLLVLAATPEGFRHVDIKYCQTDDRWGTVKELLSLGSL
jgi:hypothetical protein